VLFQIHQNRPVSLPLTEGEVIYTKNANALRFAERLVIDPAQQGAGARRYIEIRSQPLPGATAQGKADCGQRFVESNGLSNIWRYNLWQSLTEDALLTLVVIAEEFPCL